MNAGEIVTVFCAIDDVLKGHGHQSDVRARVSDAEVLTVAVVAARFFQNHHERALWVLQGMGYLTGRLSTSRFNRRLHRLSDALALVVQVLMELGRQGQVYVIDSLPMAVCKRVRASRCKKVPGRAFCGYCAAKKEKFFGWRLHLICTPAGVPIAFEMLPASLHDLTPIHELTYELPQGAVVFADKAYNMLAEERSIFDACGVRLIPIRRVNMTPPSLDG